MVGFCRLRAVRGLNGTVEAWIVGSQYGEDTWLFELTWRNACIGAGSETEGLLAPEQKAQGTLESNPQCKRSSRLLSVSMTCAEKRNKDSSEEVRSVSKADNISI